MPSYKATPIDIRSGEPMTLVSWCDDCDPGGIELTIARRRRCVVCSKVVGPEGCHTRWRLMRQVPPLYGDGKP